MLCITAMLEFARLNRAKDAAERAMEYDGKGDFEEMGDESPLFRCVVFACLPSLSRLLTRRWMEQIHDLTLLVGRLFVMWKIA